MKARGYVAYAIALMATFVLLADTHQSSLIRAQGEQRKAEAPALLAGRVTDGLSETPIAEVEVTLRSRLSPNPPRRVLTTSSGEFVFLDVSAGTYELTATKQGYSTGSLGQRRVGGPNRPLVVGSGLIRLDLRLPLWSDGAICGTVVDENGEPFVGLRIAAIPLVASAGRLLMHNVAPRTASTNDRGQYRVYSLSPNSYVIAAFPNDRQDLLESDYLPTFQPGGISPGESGIAVTAGQERCGVDLALRKTKGYRVSGAVTGMRDTTGIVVQLISRNERFLEDFVIDQVPVDPNGGTFTFANVPAGEF